MSENDPATDADEASTTEPPSQPDLDEYWRRNVRLITGLFVIWFLVSFLAAILLAPQLTQIQFGSIPLSFWFAQQGSIAVFVLLIYIYAKRMNKLDREFGVQD